MDKNTNFKQYWSCGFEKQRILLPFHQKISCMMMSPEISAFIPPLSRHHLPAVALLFTSLSDERSCRIERHYSVSLVVPGCCLLLESPSFSSQNLSPSNSHVRTRLLCNALFLIPWSKIEYGESRDSTLTAESPKSYQWWYVRFFALSFWERFRTIARLSQPLLEIVSEWSLTFSLALLSSLPPLPPLSSFRSVRFRRAGQWLDVISRLSLWAVTAFDGHFWHSLEDYVRRPTLVQLNERICPIPHWNDTQFISHAHIPNVNKQHKPRFYLRINCFCHLICELILFFFVTVTHCPFRMPIIKCRMSTSSTNQEREPGIIPSKAITHSLRWRPKTSRHPISHGTLAKFTGISRYTLEDDCWTLVSQIRSFLAKNGPKIREKRIRARRKFSNSLYHIFKMIRL